MILIKSALRWKFDLSSQALESLHNVTENFTIYTKMTKCLQSKNMESLRPSYDFYNFRRIQYKYVEYDTRTRYLLSVKLKDNLNHSSLFNTCSQFHAVDVC